MADNDLTSAGEIQPSEQSDRQAQPVDAEQPPRLSFPVVGIGASAGGLEAFSVFLAAMRPDAGMSFVLIQHLPPDRESMLVEILSKRTDMPVRHVEDNMPVEQNEVYVIRPGHVLTIRDGRLRLGPPLGSSRAANRPVDDFFKSLAEEQRERAVCILLSGMGSNGTAGAQAVKAVGGLCIAQDPETAQFPSMPQHMIDAGYADYVLPPADMPEVLMEYASHPYARGGREADAATILQHEDKHLREIFAVLRTRTRHDFSGYKKPTVLRRVQRRMGLVRVRKIHEYMRMLRQNPAEVTALADDLLIHVTGFFRDPRGWEVLQKRCIAPLIAARDAGSSIRAWVTACSSGEEAYTLAMLLIEEAGKAGKQFDIKVFATDLADRALAHARAGLYSGGIESEITPERLARFFTPDDAMYRVRQDLRDRVVFAPQNALQDPPFSRLDIISCRNLLIYLEPNIQLRLLTLLHFGLREGGTLFLGTSEAISGAEDLFEPIDKKARIYRRIGATRHGMLDFPSSRGLPAGDAGIKPLRAIRRYDPAQPTLVHLAHQELLKHHTPAAVIVDRAQRILYFHGDGQAYLAQPTGEPTRDLMHLVREGVRSAARVALHRAMTEHATAVTTDGWVDSGPGRRSHVTVTVSPIPAESPGGAPELFAISFTKMADVTSAPPSNGERSNEELLRLRSELQSTVEEIQTSNEELKASNEEIMSINEELQSANEEMETSKEEMQSLNEELSMVNSQLRVKMEEHQAISSDLACLLASTDVAVLFLDPEFRIRRFTPAAREMIDLIAGDVGRPLSALTRKFDDPNLDADCQSVLERLVPIMREVIGALGKTYQRRVLPYRTANNRIDGVVITFVDITPRKEAESALAASEEQFRRAIEDAPIPVIMQAENGEVLLVSRTWTELTGYTVNDMPTADAWLTRAYGPRAEAIRTSMNELFRGDKKSFNVEFIIATRDRGERYWSFSASAPGKLHDGRKFVVGMALDLTERKRAEDNLHKIREELESRVQQRTSELIQSAEQLRSVARELTLVEQRERRQLATTLHDQLQQLIVGARLRLDSLPSLNQSDLAKETATIENLLSECLTVCRTLTAELSPPILYEEGLFVALEWLANWIEERHGLTVTLSKSTELPVLYNDVKILFFESVRELLFNVVKHSSVKAAEVALDYDEPAQRLRVAVSDKGTGFEPARSAFRSRAPIGFGLFSIRERLKMIGGDLEIVSQPGKGSRISLILTLDKFNDLEDS